MPFNFDVVETNVSNLSNVYVKAWIKMYLEVWKANSIL
jgi:hypothetical protein